uniref:Uncharacterized protein n=1 Tax=Ignisphaera aggregans TaxID=334771 RepID=A0A7J2U2N1_9CREN
MPELKQVQIQVSEEYWRRKLEELGVKFDEVVMEILKEDYKRRSNPYEAAVNAISQYVYDLASRLFGLAEEINSDICEKKVLLALAKLEDIANDITLFVKDMRKVLPKARI